MRNLPRNAQFWVGAICLLGLGAALVEPLLPAPAERGAPWELALFLALGVLAGRTKVRLMPRREAEDIGSLSLSFALIFAALLRFGPGPAMLVGGLSTLSSCLYPKRQPPHQIAFNLGLSAFATFAAGRVFLWTSGGEFTTDRFPLFAAVMTSCLSFFLINSLAVASAITLSTGKNMGRVWSGSFLWTAPSYFAAAGAGTLAILLLGTEVGTVLLFVTPVAALTYLAYTLSRRRTEENQQQIQELQAHEAQMAEDLRHEHQIAETLQRSLRSTPAEDAFPGLRVHTEYEPAWKEALVGGDFYDALALGDGKVALVVGDVTGKGLAAATHTAEVKYALRVILHECPDPARALARLNRFLTQAQPGVAWQPLVAVALAVVDTQTGEAAVSSAGAEHPLLLRADGRAEEILAGGMLLGTLREADYESQTLRLAPGDCLLMVTDGLIEARHGKEFFGYDGLTQAAQQAQARGSTSTGNSTGNSMVKAIIAEAKRFAGSALHDDVCLLLVQREPASVRLLPGSVVYSPGERVAETAVPAML